MVLASRSPATKVMLAEAMMLRRRVLIFQSNKHTQVAEEERRRWLGNGCVIERLRVSMPPYNVPKHGVQLPAGHQNYNVSRTSHARLYAHRAATTRRTST